MKKGEFLVSALQSQRISQFKPEEAKETPTEIEYESVDKLLKRRTLKNIGEITPAMKEYASTRLFSSGLELKKDQNLEKFFVVTTI